MIVAVMMQYNHFSMILGERGLTSGIEQEGPGLNHYARRVGAL